MQKTIFKLFLVAVVIITNLAACTIFSPDGENTTAPASFTATPFHAGSNAQSFRSTSTPWNTYVVPTSGPTRTPAITSTKRTEQTPGVGQNATGQAPAMVIPPGNNYTNDTPTPEPTSTYALNSSLYTLYPLGLECTDAVTRINAIPERAGLPEHYMYAQDASPQAGEFDPDSYLNILTHLQLQPGYALDFVYIGDELGGHPLVYAHPTSTPAFQTYSEFLESVGQSYVERSYEMANYAYDYLGYLVLDDTAASYLQFAILANVADEFYLFWHGLYNDTVVLCSQNDIQQLSGDLIVVPEDVLAQARNIDLTPSVIMGPDVAQVRMVTFTKWGGFIEFTYWITRDASHQLVDVRTRVLVPYDCGVYF